MGEDNKNLNEILLGREERAIMQRKLIRIYKIPLVCFTLNIPGADKNSPIFIKVHKTGMEAFEEEILRHGMKMVHREFRGSTSGPEAYFCIDKDPMEIKRITVYIEENHKLGRLFDFDVFDIDCMHIGRVSLGFPERKCLICGESAAVCSRSRRHSVSELLNEVHRLIDEYYFDIDRGQNVTT